MASKELLDGLQHALNREVSTFLRYMVQSSVIKGIEFQPVRQMYQSEVTDEIGHAQYLADKIAMLGGTPKLDPDLTPPPGDVKEMLKRDIAEEEKDVEHYKKLAELAEKAGLIELKLRMEDQAADEEGHAIQMQRLLG